MTMTNNEIDHEAVTAIFGNGKSNSPELELMVAVFIQQKDDLFGAEGGKFEAAALQWFKSEGAKDTAGRPWLFSFWNICEEFDLDAAAVRRGILSRYENQP